MLVPLTNVACVNANWSYNNFALGYCVSVDEELNDVILFDLSSASLLPKTYGFAYKLTDTGFTNKLLSFIFTITKIKIKKFILYIIKISRWTRYKK